MSTVTAIVAENIPADLRVLEQWVAWRYESRDGKPTKVPMRADGEGRASTMDPETWSGFEDALAAASRFDGVGFVFGQDDVYIGIDFDNCRLQNGLLEPEVASLVLLLDSYTEWLPSGRGVHVIAVGEIGGAGRRNGRVEVYSHGRVRSRSFARAIRTCASIATASSNMTASTRLLLEC